MYSKLAEPSATVAATVGLLALASAMGIGRFSLTPILPLMQHDMGLTFAQGGWLATGNYLGYLVGALICMAFAPRPVRAIRWGLICVAVLTVAMGLSRSPLLWFAFRFSAGVASAFVLVGVSAWAMPILARCNKDQWSGFVFAGVGIGIVFAGLVGLAAGLDAWGSHSTWIVMGVVAAALAFFPLVAAGHERGPHGRGGVKNTRGAASSFGCCRLLRPVWLRLHHSGDLPSRVGSRIYRRSGGVRLGLASVRDRCRHFYTRCGTVQSSSGTVAFMDRSSVGAGGRRIGPRGFAQRCDLADRSDMCGRHLHGHYDGRHQGGAAGRRPAGVARCRHDDRCFRRRSDRSPLDSKFVCRIEQRIHGHQHHRGTGAGPG
jgi:MFS family permease